MCPAAAEFSGRVCDPRSPVSNELVEDHKKFAHAAAAKDGLQQLAVDAELVVGLNQVGNRLVQFGDLPVQDFEDLVDAAGVGRSVESQVCDSFWKARRKSLQCDAVPSRREFGS